ncbi:MAG: hypothetical protein R6U00_06305 [Prochlorococcaceae cyanobacterium]
MSVSKLQVPARSLRLTFGAPSWLFQKMLSPISDDHCEAIRGGRRVSYKNLASDGFFGSSEDGQVGNGTIGNSFAAFEGPDNFGQFNVFSANAAVSLLGFKNKGELNRSRPGLTGAQVRATNPSNF